MLLMFMIKLEDFLDDGGIISRFDTKKIGMPKEEVKKEEEKKEGEKKEDKKEGEKNAAKDELEMDLEKNDF